MRVRVNPDLCTGCGLCVSTAPDLFEMVGDVAKEKVETVPPELEPQSQVAADNCPVEAIKIE